MLAPTLWRRNRNSRVGQMTLGLLLVLPVFHCLLGAPYSLSFLFNETWPTYSSRDHKTLSHFSRRLLLPLKTYNGKPGSRPSISALRRGLSAKKKSCFLRDYESGASEEPLHTCLFLWILMMPDPYWNSLHGPTFRPFSSLRWRACRPKGMKE